MKSIALSVVLLLGATAAHAVPACSPSTMVGETCQHPTAGIVVKQDMSKFMAAAKAEQARRAASAPGTIEWSNPKK